MKHIKLFEGFSREENSLILEFDYEKHKQEDLDIIDRFIISINPGTDDVLEVEGLLARTKHHKLVFKPLTNTKIFKSSDSRKLLKDEEINLNQASRNTDNAVNHLNTNINNWLAIKTDYDNLVHEIRVGKIIDVARYGTSMIGGLNCIFNTIKFDKI